MISVCMASYNGERFIREQISSILPQLGENDELVISDDKSKDTTVEIIKGFKDKRIKLLIHKEQSTYTANFENALKNCKGDYIFLCDQDDIWMPNKVKVMMKYLLNGYDMVISDAIVVDEELNIKIESRNKHFGIKNGFLHNFIKSRYLGCCFAFNKKVRDSSLPFPRNTKLAHHDSWISLIAEMKFRTIVIDEPLMKYRRHFQNASTGGETRSSFLKIAQIRIYLFTNLIKRIFQH